MPEPEIQNALSLGVIVHPYFWDFEKYPYRGIDRYNEELIKGFRRLGVTLDVYDSGYVHTHAEGIFKELLFPFRFAAKQARCFFAVHAMSGKWALLLGKKPVVTMIQDMLPFAYGEGQYDWAVKYFFKRRSIAFAAKKSDRLVVAYPSTKQEVVARFGIDPDKVVVIPYGIDHHRFAPGPVKRGSPRRVFFLGEAVRAKGADTVLRAFKLLRERTPDVELKMGSRGRELEDLKRLAAELGILDRTEFLGRIPDEELPNHYRNADVFVFPSRHGFGLPTIEAMACGIPTVSGKIFDAIDFVGDAGLLADPNSPEEVAQQLGDLLTDDALWLTYRERGLARARQFSWDRMAKETLEVCEEAIRARAGSRRVKSKKLLSLVAAIVATVVVGYFVLQKLRWSDLVLLHATSDLRFLALGFAAYSGANVLRAARFRALTGDRIPSVLFLRTVIIQNLLNTFLPLRAGEASYLYMVHKSGTVKASDNISSLLGARILDLLAALLIPALALPLSQARSASGLPLGWLLAVPVVGIALFALGLSRAEALAAFIAARAASAQKRAWLQRSLQLASDILLSLAQLRSGRLLGRVALLTASCWALIYVCGYFSLIGVGLRLPFFDCVFAYGFPVIISMMPFYMLGGFGVYEGTLGVGLNLIGVPLGLATAASLALHVAELSFIVLPAPLTLLPRLWSRSTPNAAE